MRASRNFSVHLKGSARGRTAQPQTDAARRPDQASGPACTRLDAAGLPGAEKSGASCVKKMDRAGAIEAADAGGAASRAVARIPAAGSLRQRLLRLKGRHENADSCPGPTHEEVITDIVQKSAQLQAAAAELLSGADQIPATKCARFLA